MTSPNFEASDADGDLLDLPALAAELLDEAHRLAAGRTARTLTPGAGAPLKQTLLALTAGTRLQEHVAPGPTTLIGVVGTCTVRSGGTAVTLTDGVWTPCPVGPHDVEAVTDTVILLTVVANPTNGRGEPTNA